MPSVEHPRPSALGATVAIALTAICFGLTPLFAREMQAQGGGSASIALYRYVFSVLVLWPFLPVRRAVRREALLLGLAGLFMGVGWIGYLEAVKAAPIAATGVVYMSYPLFTVLFAWWLVGQRPGARALGAAGLILCAAALLVERGGLDGAARLALLWSLPAPITFGFIVVVLCAMTPNLTALERMAAGLTGAVIGLAPLAFAFEAATLAPQTLHGWGLIVGLGVCTALAPQLVYTLAAPRVGPARAAAAGAFELPTMLVIGWLAFGEPLGLREAAAAALVLAAIALAPAIAPARTARATA